MYVMTTRSNLQIIALKIRKYLLLLIYLLVNCKLRMQISVLKVNVNEVFPDQDDGEVIFIVGKCFTRELSAQGILAFNSFNSRKSSRLIVLYLKLCPVHVSPGHLS